MKHRSFVRSIVRCAVHLKYDSQGRIALPESLLSYAKINKDVSIIGMIKKIEIWSPKLLQTDNMISDEDFDDIANEIKF